MDGSLFTGESLRVQSEAVATGEVKKYGTHPCQAFQCIPVHHQGLSQHGNVGQQQWCHCIEGGLSPFDRARVCTAKALPHKFETQSTGKLSDILLAVELDDGGHSSERGRGGTIHRGAALEITFSFVVESEEAERLQ